MRYTEFSDQFDVLYNNITSNQAPGLTEYEKSVFLTKAQNELVKNYFTANSKGNNLGQGFDDSAKRQADFSCLMKTSVCTPAAGLDGNIDSRSTVYKMPSDIFIPVNETIILSNPKDKILQVIPLRYDEYTRLMSKPFKRPVKNQAWRLLNSGTVSLNNSSRYAEIIVGPSEVIGSYRIRYVRVPKPIIVGDLDGLSIDSYTFGTGAGKVQGCELDSVLHPEILQRAVELAKVAWTTTGQENLQSVMQAGQRSE